MSYCVNCGVELAEGEKKCPLCDVPVINPAASKEEPSEHAYPQELEAHAHIDRRYVASLAAMVMLIPIGICLFVDMLSGGGISWSFYVLGTLVTLYALCFVPALIPRSFRLLFSILIDTVVTAAFLWLICFVSGGSWFMSALPMCLVTYGFTLGLAALLHFMRRTGILARTALVLTFIGVYTMYIEWQLSILRALPMSWWSVFALVPCLLLSGILLLLNRNMAFREQIRRRFFI